MKKFLHKLSLKLIKKVLIAKNTFQKKSLNNQSKKKFLKGCGCD